MPNLIAARDRRERLLAFGLSLLVFLGTWELIPYLPGVDVRLTSRPTLLAIAGVDLLRDPEIWRHILLSSTSFVTGFAVSVLVGVPTGLCLGWFRRLRLLLDPIVMGIYSIPRTALIPLVMVWFGIGIKTHATIVFLGAVFAIMVNTSTGVQLVDPPLLRAARSFGATPLQIFSQILVPSALPYIMGGIRLGLGRALIGVIVGEMYVSTAGIGNLIMTYQSGLNTDKLIFLVFLVSAGGVAVIALARRVEDRLGPWRKERGVA